MVNVPVNLRTISAIYFGTLGFVNNNKQWYGESYLPADEVIKLEENRHEGDILENL